jgi:omega-amidase
MHDLKVALIETALHWENPQANRAELEEVLSRQTGHDLIVLPEMFTTGFTMNAAALAEPPNLYTYRWMKQMAQRLQAVLMGSIIVKEQGHYYNRLLWVQPDGIVKHYDKRHLFRMAGEDSIYTAGNALPIFEWKGWRIAPQICYDLRFPVWSRNIGLKYDVLVYVANWPEAREAAWNTLLPARAIENAAYAVGVNRIGEDAKGITYSGASAAYDFLGKRVTNTTKGIQEVSLSMEALLEYRTRFPVHLDADHFNLTL